MIAVLVTKLLTGLTKILVTMDDGLIGKKRIFPVGLYLYLCRWAPHGSTHLFNIFCRIK